MIPNPDRASIPPEKIRDYLLSPDHPVGRYKATFFGSLGYSQPLWGKLEEDIRGTLSQRSTLIEESEYGTKYGVRGTLIGPNGKSASIVTVWIVRNGEDFPRLVTAYPES